MKKLLLSGLLALTIVFSYSNTASAGVLFGVSGSGTKSTADSVLYVRLGSGYSVTGLRYVSVAVEDNHSASYFGNPVIIECGANDTFPSSSCTGGTHEVTAGETVGGGNYYTVAQNGHGKRVITFDFGIRCIYTGGSCSYATGTVTMTSTKFYWLRFITTNSKNSAAQAGSTALYGSDATLHTADGTPISVLYGGTETVDTSVGTPYHYGSDTVLVSGVDSGFYLPASSSSAIGLSGAGSFCSGIASPSSAFGIPYGLCFISGYLFIPSGGAIDSFFTNAAVVKEKVPWSYAVDFQTAWSTATSNSVAFEHVSIPWTVMGASTSLSLISSASFYRWISPSTWATVRGFTTVGLYLAIAWYGWSFGRRMFKLL